MSDLLGNLSMAARSMAAQQAGLATTGQNIANINTPGYTRRTAELVAAPPVDPLSAGNGVDVVAIRAARADLLEAQLRKEQPALGREAAMSESLSQVEAALSSTGNLVDAGLTKFFSAFSQLSQDPTSGVARQQVTVQGQELANTFNDVSTRLLAAQRDTDKQVKSSVDQVNALAAEIASLNAAIGGVSQTAGEAMRDKLGVALSSLSQLVDIGVVPRSNGGADVTVANGRALVIGASSYQLGVAPAAGSGLADLTSGGVVVTSEVTGGRVGGLLQVRDTQLPGYVSRIDQLAYDLATSINTTHKAGFDLNGNPGGDFFAPLASAAGAASTLKMSAAVTANGNLIAAAGTTSAGDNQTARAITNLQRVPLGAGTTSPIETWGALIYRVGTDSQTASSNKSERDEIVNQLQTLRDQVSGVSLDEEAGNLQKFQRAYEANARYFSAIQTSLDVLMQMVN